MSEIEQAAERVRRVFRGETVATVYGLGVKAAVQYTADRFDLSNAFANQAPTYAELTAKLAEAESEIEAMKADRLKLARAYDPNCDEYSYISQREAMVAARQTVEAMQELAEFLGRDPEGCLADCPDEAMGRIENAERRLAYFDDATPLTGEWCEANGAKHKDGYGWIFKGPKQLELIVTLERVYVHFGYSSILVMTNPTLGAFRRLATGLGIQLKEDA